MIRRGALLAGLGLALIARAPFAHAPFARAPFDLTGDPVLLLWPRITDGNRALTRAELAGPLVLLNIGATRCPPCWVEMPAPDALQRILCRTDFAVVPVLIDKDGIFAARCLYDDYRIRNFGVYGGEDLRAHLAFALLARQAMAQDGTNAEAMMDVTEAFQSRTDGGVNTRR